jgi:hypothetical protein
MTDLTTSRFAVPDHVTQSQRAREIARNQHHPCAGDGGLCRRTAKHACTRCGGAYCPEHWDALDLVHPTPDPARTVAGLQARARAEGRMPAEPETAA